MSSRASKTNTKGGSAFKKGKKGGLSFRAIAAQEAADDMMVLLSLPEDKLKAADVEALKYMMVARIVKRLGNGRMEVFCQDGKTRQSVIRGLLRRKGQVPIDVDCLVVISLRSDDRDDGDENGMSGSDIIGLLGSKHLRILQGLDGDKISKSLIAGSSAIDEDGGYVFDYTEEETATASASANGGNGGNGGNGKFVANKGSASDEIDIDAI